MLPPPSMTAFPAAATETSPPTAMPNTSSPKARPATVAKEAAPPAATTKAYSTEAAAGVFPSTPKRSLPNHSGKIHSDVAATKASLPVATAAACDVPARGHHRGLTPWPPPPAIPRGTH